MDMHAYQDDQAGGKPARDDAAAAVVTIGHELGQRMADLTRALQLWRKDVRHGHAAIWTYQVLPVLQSSLLRAQHDTYERLSMHAHACHV